MNPPTVTWAPHLYTDIGWKNFEAWMHVGGHDNILFTPNGKLHRLLTRLAFKNLLHPFQPFIVVQRIIGPAIAKKIGVEKIRDIIRDYGFSINDFEPYIPPAAKQLKQAGIEVHYLGYYLKWDPQECY